MVHRICGASHAERCLHSSDSFQQSIKEHIKLHICSGNKILHVGAGNSILAECLLASHDFPANLNVVNVDISQNIIDRMADRLNSLIAAGPHSTSAKHDLDGFRELSDILSTGRKLNADQICYQLADVTDMPEFPDSSFDVVLDKGAFPIFRLIIAECLISSLQGCWTLLFRTERTKPGRTSTSNASCVSYTVF
jgi:hypothetical protein